MNKLLYLLPLLCFFGLRSMDKRPSTPKRGSRLHAKTNDTKLNYETTNSTKDNLRIRRELASNLYKLKIELDNKNANHHDNRYHARKLNF